MTPPIRIATILIIALTFAGAGIMLLTGYMPASGYGHNPAHALHLGLLAGAGSAGILLLTIDLIIRPADERDDHPPSENHPDPDTA